MSISQLRSCWCFSPCLKKQHLKPSVSATSKRNRFLWFIVLFLYCFYVRHCLQYSHHDSYNLLAHLLGPRSCSSAVVSTASPLSTGGPGTNFRLGLLSITALSHPFWEPHQVKFFSPQRPHRAQAAGLTGCPFFVVKISQHLPLLAFPSSYEFLASSVTDSARQQAVSLATSCGPCSASFPFSP